MAKYWKEKQQRACGADCRAAFTHMCSLPPRKHPRKAVSLSGWHHLAGKCVQSSVDKGTICMGCNTTMKTAMKHKTYQSFYKAFTPKYTAKNFQNDTSYVIHVFRSTHTFRNQWEQNAFILSFVNAYPDYWFIQLRSYSEWGHIIPWYRHRTTSVINRIQSAEVGIIETEGSTKIWQLPWPVMKKNKSMSSCLCSTAEKSMWGHFSRPV